MKSLSASCVCILFLPLILLIVTSFSMPDNFRLQQQKFPRVKQAYTEKEKLVREMFLARGIELGSADIFIRAFKKEAQLEVWARKHAEGIFKLIRTYDICASSGVLGPKRTQGDSQVPEGFYEIDRFNPSSNYYLSLGLNYPNASDKILGNKANYGGDIFIHGNCVTIGCMPLTDDKIKEVYLMAVEARSGYQQRIPVHVFPCRLDAAGIKVLETDFASQPDLIEFWKNLEIGYRFFNEKRSLPVVSVLPSGFYSFK
jgi:murein L,D-transpeptidase YafK